MGEDAPGRGSGTCENERALFVASLPMAAARRLADEMVEAVRVQLMKDIV